MALVEDLQGEFQLIHWMQEHEIAPEEVAVPDEESLRNLITGTLQPPESASGQGLIQNTILNCLGHMRRLDVFTATDIRYGARHFQNSIIGPGRQPLLPDSLPQ